MHENVGTFIATVTVEKSEWITGGPGVIATPAESYDGWICEGECGGENQPVLDLYSNAEEAADPTCVGVALCLDCIAKATNWNPTGLHTYTNEATGEVIDYHCEPFIAVEDGIAFDGAKYEKGDLLVRASGGMDLLELTPATAYAETDCTSYTPEA